MAYCKKCELDHVNGIAECKCYCHQPEVYDVVSVQGGKFHRPANTAFERNEPSWTPRLMQCGRTLEPLNFFQTVEDANSYTGGPENGTADN